MFQSYLNTPLGAWLLPIIPRDSGKNLTANSTIPSENLGKIPGQRWPGGRWSGMPKWDNGFDLQNRDHAKKVLAIWDHWYPEGRQTIGLRCRLFPGVDLDVNTRDQAEWARDAAFEVFGKTIIRGRSDGAPRLLLPYRFAEPGQFITKVRQDFKNDEGDAFAVEILGQGHQWLVEGEHASGARYVWFSIDDPTPRNSMFDIPDFGVEQLPKISLEQVYEFVKAVTLATQWRGTRRRSANTTGSTVSSRPRHTKLGLIILKRYQI